MQAVWPLASGHTESSESSARKGTAATAGRRVPRIAKGPCALEIQQTQSARTAAATACNVAVVFGWCAVQARGAQAAAAGAPREAHSKSEERPGDSSGPSVDVDVIARNRACTLAAE